MTEPTETVDLVGVRANSPTTPPRMKAREIAQSYFGPFQDDDGSESDACFGALEELIDWLVKQGWTPQQPTQAADSVLEDAARLWEAFIEAWRNEIGVDKIVNIMGGADKLKAVFLDAARKQG